MVSSGRQARGEVFSIMADYIDRLGPESFFAMLAQHAQAAFIDTRVLLAHHGLWPEGDERFAADLGLLDQVHEPWLARFSRAVKEAPLPVVVGGHGLMAGDIFAIADIISSLGSLEATSSRGRRK